MTRRQLSGRARGGALHPAIFFDERNGPAYSRRMPVTGRRVWAARGLAVLADLIQIGFAPLFLEGGLSVFDAALDLLMAAILTRLVGWHWAFLPGFLAVLVPGFDLVPSWTLAVFLATRHEIAPEVAPDSRGGRVIDVEPVRDNPRHTDAG